MSRGELPPLPPVKTVATFFPSFLADDHSFVVLRRLAAGSIVYKRGTHSRTHARTTPSPAAAFAPNEMRRRAACCTTIIVLIFDGRAGSAAASVQPRSVQEARVRERRERRGEGNAGAGCARSNVYYPGSQAARCTRAAALARGDIEQRLRAVPRSCWLGGVYGDVRIRE